MITVKCDCALFRAVKENLVPVHTGATEPLSANVLQTILPNGITIVDKRRLILYLRYDVTAVCVLLITGPCAMHFHSAISPP
jgi:hypothetical protein